MQAVQLVGCGVIGAALAVLLVSVCFWLAVRVGGVICCGGGLRWVVFGCWRGDLLRQVGGRACGVRCR